MLSVRSHHTHLLELPLDLIELLYAQVLQADLPCRCCHLFGSRSSIQGCSKVSRGEQRREVVPSERRGGRQPVATTARRFRFRRISRCCASTRSDWMAAIRTDTEPSSAAPSSSAAAPESPASATQSPIRPIRSSRDYDTATDDEDEDTLVYAAPSRHRPTPSTSRLLANEVPGSPVSASEERKQALLRRAYELGDEGDGDYGRSSKVWEAGESFKGFVTRNSGEPFGGGFGIEEGGSRLTLNNFHRLFIDCCSSGLLRKHQLLHQGQSPSSPARLVRRGLAVALTAKAF